MTARRSRGEGGLHFDETRQRWIATAVLGYNGRGKRITRKASGTTKTAAKDKLRNILRDHADGAHRTGDRHRGGRRPRLARLRPAGRASPPLTNYTRIAEARIIGPLGRRRLRDLSAEDVDRWLRAQTKEVSTRTLRLMHSILNRAIIRAMARDKVQPQRRRAVHRPDRTGRPPLQVAHPRPRPPPARRRRGSPLHAYVVLSLLSGARTEEVRALRWEHVDLRRRPRRARRPSRRRCRYCARSGRPATPRPASPAAASPSPAASVDALVSAPAQALGRPAGRRARVRHRNGTELDAHNVRRAFRRVAAAAGLDPDRLDTAGAAAQLRVAAVGLRDAAGADRPAARPQRDRRHRAGLPPPAPPGPGGRRRRDGRHLPRASQP